SRRAAFVHTIRRVRPMSSPSSSTRLREWFKGLARIGLADAITKLNNRNGCTCNEMVVSQPTMGPAKSPRGVARRASVSVALFVFSLGPAACNKSDAGASGKARPAPMVVVQKVERRDVPLEVRAPVDLRPLAQADVGSKILGYVDAILVDRGDRVKKGQLVALVRPSDLPDQLAAARSSLAQVESSAVLARTNFERAQKLAPSGVVSEQELQQASAALASAEAAQATSKAQIGALAVRLGETRIESPIDGVVSQRRLDPGALVGP